MLNFNANLSFLKTEYDNLKYQINIGIIDQKEYYDGSLRGYKIILTDDLKIYQYKEIENIKENALNRRNNINE